MRKKGIALCALLLSIFFVTGCGSSKTLTCSKEESSTGMKSEQTIKATFNKNNVKKMDMTMVMTVEDSYKSYLSLMENALKSQFDSLNDQKGITMKTSSKDNKITFNLTAEIDKMDDKAKKELNVMDTSGNYDASKKQLEKEGYKCK